MMTRHRRWIAGLKAQGAVGLAAAVLCASGLAGAADRASRPAKAPALDGAALESPAQVDSVPSFITAGRLQRDQGGTQTYIARLKTPAVSSGGSVAAVSAEQQGFIARVLAASPSSHVIASVRVVMNAVFIETDRAGLEAMGRDVATTRVVPVGDYEISLTDTVPYIGAETVHGLGIRGAGVRVAVLDSGADYTHADLGGSGNPADYAANDPTTLADGGFPNSRFIGGTDFVGSHWPLGSSCAASSTGPLEPDADPLDKAAAGCVDGSGHGTHVASIIAGVQGVAPDAKLYAVKVCSATTTSCSGVALIEGMEFAADPNGDGDPSDHVDIVNMSLGSNYGQPFDDDLSFAVDQATHVGVLTVAAAGNAGDKPYIVSTPSAAPSAISVAQTAVPSEKLNLMRITNPVVTNPNRVAIFQPWSSPLATTTSGIVLYGNGSGGNLDGCAAFPAGSLAGRVVLVNRGTCAFSIKISNIAGGGGALGIIGLIDGSQPFAGAFGGGTPNIPGFMISLADANAIRGGATVSFDPTNVLPLVGSLVATSARGPMFQNNRIKPEIGAPGASVSSEHGTGTGRTAFGGTSGATPMVSGSAALLKQFNHIIGEYEDPATLKQTLLMSAETNILAPSVPGGLVPDSLAPISRIGAGEVRVDHALTLTTSANPLDAQNYTGGISFGLVDVDKVKQTATIELLLGNRGHNSKTYTITPTARFQNDVDTGAVSMSIPSSVTIGSGRYKTLKVSLVIDGTKLRNNLMNSGSGGANPGPLTTNEYDGYILFQSGDEKFSLPWHALPRKDARVTSRVSEFAFVDDGSGVGVQSVTLQNRGVGTAQDDAYSLLAVSANLPEGGPGQQSPTPDIRALGVNTVLVPSSVCSSGFVWEFAFNDWERQSMPTGVIHEVDLDTNRDGVFDYAVYNFDLSLSSSVSDGRQVTWAENLTTHAANAFFFAEHNTNTGNTILRVCGEQVGLSSAAILSRNVDIVAGTFDFFFGGPSDVLPDVYTITPYGEQFVGVADDIAGNSTGTLTAYDFGAFPGNTPELGLMLITNGDRGAASRGGATKDTEALLFARPGGNVYVQ
jgi:subtilisin family serine protease